MTRRPPDPVRSQFLWRNRSRDPPGALSAENAATTKTPGPIPSAALSRKDDRRACSPCRLSVFCRRSWSSLTSTSALLAHWLHVGLRVGDALAGAIGVHEPLDRGVQLIPRSVGEIVVAHRKRRADEEFLI